MQSLVTFPPVVHVLLFVHKGESSGVNAARPAAVQRTPCADHYKACCGWSDSGSENAAIRQHDLFADRRFEVAQRKPGEQSCCRAYGELGGKAERGHR